MTAPEGVAVVLLAAGLSTRFGRDNKLGHDLGGLPLGLHAARTLATIPFAARVAVVAEDAPDFSAFAFRSVANPEPSAGQSLSIRLGVEVAMTFRPRAILIALADMPFVPRSHFMALLENFQEGHVVASTHGAHGSPPALFDIALAPELLRLTGDTGARALLRHARLISASPFELKDIDIPDDLADPHRG